MCAESSNDLTCKSRNLRKIGTKRTRIRTCRKIQMKFLQNIQTKEDLNYLIPTRSRTRESENDWCCGVTHTIAEEIASCSQKNKNILHRKKDTQK